MLPEVRPHVSTALADQLLEHQLHLAPHLEAGRLDVEGVAGIAAVAAAHSDGYAATGHLLGLLAALPAPTEAGERFWSDLWRSSGTAYLLPVNMKAQVLRSLLLRAARAEAQGMAPAPDDARSRSGSSAEVTPASTDQGPRSDGCAAPDPVHALHESGRFARWAAKPTGRRSPDAVCVIPRAAP